MLKLEEAIQNTIHNLRLLDKGEGVLAAVSGGPDSVALLGVLSELSRHWKWPLRVIHLNHLIRGSEADKDEHFVEEVAKRYGYQFFSKRVDVQSVARNQHLSIEDAARRSRLAFFLEAARRFNVKKIVLAHTSDDQAETVILRLLRGTGMRGLTAMKNRVEFNGMVLVRPMLGVERKDIMSYLKEKHLSYRIDPSNYALRFSRNKVRHELIPEIEKSYNPQIREHLRRLAQTLSVDFNFIDTEAKSVIARIIKKESPEQVTLNRKSFSDLHEAIQYRIALNVLKRIRSDRDLDFVHWREMREGLLNKGKFSISLSQRVEIGAERDEVIFRLRDLPKISFDAKLEASGSCNAKEIGYVFSCQELKQRLSPNEARDRSIAIFDAHHMRFPLRLRSRKEGDRFKPLGQRKEKKLKDFLIDRKVPSYEKDKIPLVCSGDKIVWVFGLEISEDFKVSRHTKRILRIEGKKTTA